MSTAAALTLLLALVTQSYTVLIALNLGAFAVAFLFEALLGDLVLGALMFSTCLAPLLFLVTNTRFSYEQITPWLSGLAGAMFPTLWKSDWACPRPFRGPLVFSAMAISLAWPIWAARELDFSPGLLYQHGLVVSKLGVPPAAAVSWMLTMVVTALIGLLLFDVFASVYAGSRQRFESRIVWPAFASCLVSAAVATYQFSGHIGFLDPGLYAGMGRASGTMLDANAFGMIAALWLPLACAKVVEAARRRSAAVAAWGVAVVLLGIGLSSTGSRTALVTAIVALVVFGLHVVPRERIATSRVIAGAVAIGAVIVAAVLLGPSLPTGTSRFFWMVDDLSPGALRGTARELWSRNGFGLAAMQLIREHPLVGVGVGGFHTLLADAAYRAGFTLQAADNAQSWYRHQLAELGVLGSLGWILWTWSFAALLLRRSGPTTERLTVGAAKGAIFGLATSSLVGMPTQHPAVTIMFMLLLFWCVTMLTNDDAPPSRAPGWRQSAGAAALLCFVAGTAYAARHDLRPADRAFSGDWDFSYGFHETPTSMRWTGAHAVEVFPTSGRWLKFMIADGPPDVDARPVRIRVWRNHEQALDVTRAEHAPATFYLRVPPGARRLMIEMTVSRTWRPDAGPMRNRDVGVSVAPWTFEEEPPPGAATVP